MKKKINIPNIKAYITGHVRYALYYSRFKWLLNISTRDQIDFRIKLMNKSCYENGSCVKCGCKTTHLQMANKSCDKPCYPPIMNKRQWLDFRIGKNHIKIGDDLWNMKMRANEDPAKVKIYKNGDLVHIKYISL